ncbi:uridylate kinase [Methylobacterium radiodurans]|uniref:amino acid kinase family protein n=1 Tax=Methylobacterium radiodurans TaxID=2202828 RepID=UPI001FE513EA|nr:uridylate kinase [Methylobacterium radiodurans]
MSAGLTVVKLGGSLLADPERLRARLRRLAVGADGPCLIVPGGGPFADAVRTAQAALGFDDRLAHRLALDAMGQMAEVFLDLEPRLALVSTLPPPPSAGEGTPRSRRGRDEVPQKGSDDAGKRSSLHEGCASSVRVAPLSRPGLTAGPPSPVEGGGRAALVWNPSSLRAGHPDIPETWDVTSDSLALWLARDVGAAACILVKSAAPPPGTGPADWARHGLVDAAFPTFAARYRGSIRIEGPAQGRVAA